MTFLVLGHEVFCWYNISHLFMRLRNFVVIQALLYLCFILYVNIHFFYKLELQIAIYTKFFMYNILIWMVWSVISWSMFISQRIFLFVNIWMLNFSTTFPKLNLFWKKSQTFRLSLKYFFIIYYGIMPINPTQ